MFQQLLTPDELDIPDISHIITEDDTPVDNFQSEKQQRLLVEPLYSSRLLTPPFIAAANVGMFYAIKQDPIVPDALLSLGVEMPKDWSQKQKRSYFVWEFGKVPEVCIEIVSNREGNELGSKKDIYARIGVAYYAVFDPLQQLQREDEMNGELLRVWVLTGKKYVELEQPFWLEPVELGLRLWEGEFESQAGLWLRWCDQQQWVVLTGAERSAEAERRASEAEARAQRLAERLQAMGIDPDEINQI